MSPTRSARLAPVLPCIAYNQSSCLSENCAFSHLPDSFSLGSGRRNVCLLSLIGRCDGWGCSYSHARDELDWTDEDVKILVNAHLQLIDAYNGRIARNPPSFHIFPFPAPQSVSWTHSTDSQPYPTPASIDPSLELETPGESYLAQQSHRSPDEPQKPADNSPQYAPPVSPYLASGGNLDGLVNEEEIPRETCEMKTPSMVSLNPFAIPFVPLGCKAVPTDDPPVITPILDPEITPSPIESEILQSPAVDVPSEVTIQERSKESETPAWGEETPKVSKVASQHDIDAWGAEATSGLAWDDVPADLWAIPNGGGGWDAGPDEDAFKTPPRISTSPIPARKPRESFKSKEKPATTSWRDRKPSEPQPTSAPQKGKSGGKKSKSENFSTKSPKFENPPTRQHERRQSNPGVVSSKKNDKRRSLVTVHSEPSVTFSEPWREEPPHQTPEMQDEELAKSYEIKPRLGSIIPSKAITVEIAKAHLQLAREKPSHVDTTLVTEGTAPVDPGINWVNGGPSRLNAKADPPREFSERSRPAGSRWGVGSRWAKLSE